jgi:malonate transporter MadM subunit
MDILSPLLEKNNLVFAFCFVGIVTYASFWFSKKFTNNKIPGSAIAIIIGLALAYIGGSISGGKKGIADLPIFSGMGLMGGAMMRDFAIVSTAMGATFTEIKKAGFIGIISLILGILISFFIGSATAYLLGYTDVKSVVTIGAGTCTFIIGPVTGTAIGASSEVIVISIAAGVVKAIFVTIVTPFIARFIGLDNPSSAMAYGGLIGTTSGVAAGLAATNPALIPYGAMTATFYTGLGCLLCPSVLYMFMRYILA